MNKIQPVKWYDQAFEANKRTNNHATMALAKWLTIEQLIKLDDKSKQK